MAWMIQLPMDVVHEEQHRFVYRFCYSVVVSHPYYLFGCVYRCSERTMVAQSFGSMRVSQHSAFVVAVYVVFVAGFEFLGKNRLTQNGLNFII